MGKIRTSDINNEDTEVPDWDTTEIRMRGWLRALPEYLEELDEDFVILWSQGAITSRDAVLGPTESHTIALRDNMVREHTFEKPISDSIFQESTLTSILSSRPDP